MRLILRRVDLAAESARMRVDPTYALRMRHKCSANRWRAFVAGEPSFEHVNPCSKDGTTRRRVLDGKCAACNQRTRQARKIGR